MLRPFVHLNLAVGADGAVAAHDGHAVSISCATDWRRVHLLRESYDAVAVGARTWIRDRPRLTVRREVVGREPARQPAQVIFGGGSSCELPPLAGRRTFVVSCCAPGGAGIHVPVAGRELSPALAALAHHGVRSLLVEGGPTLLSSFLEQGIYDRVTVYVPTTSPSEASTAVRRALAAAPALAAEPFGRGLLLATSRNGVVPPAASAPAGEPAEPSPLELPSVEVPTGRLVYLDPDACGIPNDGCRGERLALMGPVPLPLQLDGVTRNFAWYVFARVPAGQEEPSGPLTNSVLVYGDLGAQNAPLVRLHSGCHTGDLFGSMRCDCGPQLEQALLAIVAAGAGVAVYLTEHEGRGIGLWAKARAYLLQDAGLDTYEANRRLGLPEDGRCYTDGAVVLAALLGRRPGASLRVRLLSNNPVKRDALARCGFDVVEMRGLVAGHNAINQRYLATKARHGHRLPEPEVAPFIDPPFPKSIGRR